MKQWIVVPFLLLILTGKVLADTSAMPRSGLYAVASIEPVEANPMVDMILPEIEESMERAWIRYERQTGHADVYMEGQEDPQQFNFDFEGRLATSPDHPSAELQLSSPEQFLLINGTPFEIVFTFQRIDEDGPEFAALQSAREEWLEEKRATTEAQERRLAEIIDVESIAPSIAVPVDWDLPYAFNMPVDWVRGGITFNDTESFVAEGLHVSPAGADRETSLLTIGRLSIEDNTFQQSVISPDYIQQTLHLEEPQRSLTVFMDEAGDIGLLGLVPDEQGKTSFWHVPPGSGEKNIQTVVAMFHTARMQDSQEEQVWFTNPDVWPNYRLAEGSEQKLREHIEDALSLKGFVELAVSSMERTEGVSLSDDGDHRIHTALKVFRADEEPEPLSPNDPFLVQGSSEEGKLTLWDDGACEVSLSVPIFSSDMEKLTSLRISGQEHSDLDQDPERWQQGRCIAIWSALQDFRDQLESAYVTETHPTLARSLEPFVTAYPEGGYILVVEQVDGERLSGLLSLEGETILPNQFESIEILSDGILADDTQGNWVFSSTGEKLLSMPLKSFFPVEGLDGHYIAVHKNEQEEVRYGLFDMVNKKMVVPIAFRELSFDEEKEVLLAEYPDRSEAVLSPDGEIIGERFASIHPLSGTSNYLVKDDEEDLWYFADEQLEKQSEPYASANLQRAARLVSVRFPETEQDETDKAPAYFNYDGSRVTSTEMIPVYAPSDDGFITVRTEISPPSDVSEAPKMHWGLIDRTGEVVIPLEYDQLHQAREGVVPVRRDDKFAIFAVDGTQLTDFKWGNLSLSFSGGLMARTPSLDEWQLIDHQGRLLNERTFTERPVYAAVDHHETGVSTDIFTARYEQKFGIISAKGEILVPFEYESVNMDAPAWPVFTDSAGKEMRYPFDFRQ